MKKSLLALAILGAVSAPAFSQMVIFGKIDQSVGKNLNTKDKQVMDNAGSRIAFRGYEDLGGGMGALFMFEHRFAPDTGVQGTPPTAATATAAATPGTFWDGFAFVGLRTAFGTVTAGRQYTSAFLGVQNAVDPFAGEGVAALRNIGSGISLAAAKVRVNDSIKYANNFGPVAVSVDVSESSQPTSVGTDRPLSVSIGYTGGPLWVGVSYEDPNGAQDDLINVGARYTVGPATLSAMYSTGTLANRTDIQAFLLGAKIKVGAGDVKLGLAQNKFKAAAGPTAGRSLTLNQRIGLGYDHNLSKRTKVYGQFAREGKFFSTTQSATAALGGNANVTNKTGYEFGIQHNF